MKLVHISALAALVVATQVAFAQPGGPRMEGGPGSGPGSSQMGSTTTTTTTGGDPGTVSNMGSIASSTSTSATDATTDTSDPALSNTSGKEMANTGGEPQLMLMAGLVLAACGLLLRRKMAGQAV